MSHYADAAALCIVSLDVIRQSLRCGASSRHPTQHTSVSFFGQLFNASIV